MRVTDVETVEIALLAAADTPRCSGQSMVHTRFLADRFDVLPPIIVHRPSMRVIDGMHRLRAAQLLNRTHLQARFFDGGEIEAFILAITANLADGLPLSPVERRAAARRLVAAVPHWSDVRIAHSSGLTTADVSAIRLVASGVVSPARRNPSPPAAPERDRSSLLRHLGKDPSLRFSDTGRNLLRRLQHSLLDPVAVAQLASATPEHCAGLAAELAAACAHDWHAMSKALTRRGRATT